MNPYQPPRGTDDGGDSPELAAPRFARSMVFFTSVAVLASILFAPLFSFPTLILLGIAASRAWPQPARIGARVLGMLVGMLVVWLVITGLVVVGDPESVVIHRWSSHVATIVSWCSVPFAVGVLVEQKLVRSPIWAILQSLILLLALAIAFVAGVTGYLGPIRTPDLDAETRVRFVILHQILLPAVLAGLLVIWHYVFRSVSRNPPV